MVKPQIIPGLVIIFNNSINTLYNVCSAHGGCSVHLGDTWVHQRDIMSTSGDVQYPPDVLNTPDVLNIPRCTEHTLYQVTNEGTIPEMLKVAKIILVHKKNDEFVTGNYRPIPLLSVFHKLLEKLLYKRVKSFLEKHEISYKYQYGFRTNYSTSHALVDRIYIYLYLSQNYMMEPKFKCDWPRTSTLRIP